MEQTQETKYELNNEVIELEQVVESLCNSTAENVESQAEDEIKEAELVTIANDIGQLFRPSLVIVEAENTSPSWSLIEVEVERILKEYMQSTNNRFVVYQKTSQFLKPEVNIKSHKIYFEDPKQHSYRAPQISYDGVPFIVLGKKLYDCEYGMDRNMFSKKKLLDIKALEVLKKFSQDDELQDNGQRTIKRRKHAISKKHSCPCKIVLRDTIFFPDHMAKKKTEYLKRKAAKTLLQDFNDRRDIRMIRKVFINLPSIDEHQNHPSERLRIRKRRRNKLKDDDEQEPNITEPVNQHDYADQPRENEMVAGLPHTAYKIWSKHMLDLVRKLNNFYQPGSSKDLCRPFLVKGIQCGIISLPVLTELQLYPETFTFVKEEPTKNIKCVSLANNLRTSEDRTQAVSLVIQKMREKKCFPTLDGWRDELYSVSSSFGSEILLEIERSASCLFGIHTYGVHVNGFVQNADSDMSMWIGKRSESKQTWPGKLDNIVGGGLTSRENVRAILIKECLEEAMIPEELAQQAKPVGTVSYTYEDERGIFPETQFVFDLQIPESFQPMNLDGEVQAFYLLSIEEIKALIATDEFKPNCALVVLDFLIRHGFINPDDEPNYVEMVKGIHS